MPLLLNVHFDSSTALAHVVIGRQDHWRSLGRGEGRELTVSSVLLRGVVVHKGLRYDPTNLSTFEQLNSLRNIAEFSLASLSSHPSPPLARSSSSPSSHSHLVYSLWSNGNYGGTLNPQSLLLIEVAMTNHKQLDQDASKGKLLVSLLHRESLGKGEVRVLNRLGVLCL